ncbi:MAG: hypothetical protein R3325_08880 [Thermoanaerobaculia bacterium]|nr:hypothetical protein [Thermoanaerobaculia bacterium]
MKLGSSDRSPTMIIPSGTEIQVDVHGQLSIRTPGNLVIQSSGNYSTLESKTGSIRIEPTARVEAVEVRCAETCFIEGSLTAWRVMARAIHLEDSARANIVLQEADRLEVGTAARLVGNFGSESELFGLFSRFADQLRSMPLFSEREESRRLGRSDRGLLPDRGREGEGDGRRRVEVETSPLPPEPEAEPRRAPSVNPDDLPDPLFFSLVILEREFGRPNYGPTSQRVLEELIKLLRERDLDTLRATYRTLFGKIVEPGKDLQRVYEMIGGWFRG